LRTYEVMFISAPSVAEDDLNKLITQLETIITERGGKVTKVDIWGRRKLAYKIDKFDEGVYSLIYAEGSGREIAEVERRLRVTDFVIRHLTVRTDEDLKRAEKMKAKRKTVVANPAAEGAADVDDDDDMEEDD
jgi:small subunit ribosomal protein S6